MPGRPGVRARARRGTACPSSTVAGAAGALADLLLQPVRGRDRATTIVNLALPAIADDLHAGYSGLQWTVDAYTLVLAALLMLAGSVADRIGRRRIFRTGLCCSGSGRCCAAWRRGPAC